MSDQSPDATACGETTSVPAVTATAPCARYSGGIARIDPAGRDQRDVGKGAA